MKTEQREMKKRPVERDKMTTAINQRDQMAAIETSNSQPPAPRAKDLKMKFRLTVKGHGQTIVEFEGHNELPLALTASHIATTRGNFEKLFTMVFIQTAVIQLADHLQKLLVEYAKQAALKEERKPGKYFEFKITTIQPEPLRARYNSTNFEEVGKPKPLEKGA
ncbi:MAG: hypothetical protein JWM16_5655 [Verrucomicrobiales bacterium]|nr:hypothetical protein [Verrucomicrobiales bacterium]